MWKRSKTGLNNMIVSLENLSHMQKQMVKSQDTEPI
jgi:hypothetical protein